jgi:hypothetical protein
VTWSTHTPPGGGTSGPVNNSLTDNSPTDQLSAAQGVVLQSEIAALQASITKGNEQVYIPKVNGQTVFTLPSVPKDPLSVSFILNGEVYVQGADFTLGPPSSTTLTWINPIVIQSTDTIIASYK